MSACACVPFFDLKLMLPPAPNLGIWRDPGRKVTRGRLMLTVGSRGGAICGDGWGDAEADVACRMLNKDHSKGVALRYFRSYM